MIRAQRWGIVGIIYIQCFYNSIAFSVTRRFVFSKLSGSRWPIQRVTENNQFPKSDKMLMSGHIINTPNTFWYNNPQMFAGPNPQKNEFPNGWDMFPGKWARPKIVSW